jgi:hypothetical protein
MQGIQAAGNFANGNSDSYWSGGNAKNIDFP